MPEALQFEFVPCKKNWINLFREYHPDSRDIGLYFFPGDGERAVNYDSLLESLRLKELAMRKQIDDVELLVFTSALLPMDCKYWKGKYFLWGVFHHLKRDTTVPSLVDKNEGDCNEEGDMEIDMIGGVNIGRLDVAVQKEHPLVDKNEGDCNEEGDMEIDMIGGVNVGRLDVAVKKEHPGIGKDCKNCKDDHSTASPLPRFGLLSSVARILSSDVKVGPPDDIPPGFEEEYGRRVGDTTIDNNDAFVVGRKS